MGGVPDRYRGRRKWDTLRLPIAMMPSKCVEPDSRTRAGTFRLPPSNTKLSGFSGSSSSMLFEGTRSSKRVTMAHGIGYSSPNVPRDLEPRDRRDAPDFATIRLLSVCMRKRNLNTKKYNELPRKSNLRYKPRYSKSFTFFSRSPSRSHNLADGSPSWGLDRTLLVIKAMQSRARSRPGPSCCTCAFGELPVPSFLRTNYPQLSTACRVFQSRPCLPNFQTQSEQLTGPSLTRAQGEREHW